MLKGEQKNMGSGLSVSVMSRFRLFRNKMMQNTTQDRTTCMLQTRWGLNPHRRRFPLL